LAVAPSLSHRRLRLPHYVILEASIFQLSIITINISWFGRFAKSGTPPKGVLIFYPPFHAHICFVSLRTYAQLSHLWWWFDCRNPLRSSAKSSLPSMGACFYSAVLGVFNCRSNKNSPDNNNDSAFFRKKKNPANLASIPHFQSVHRNMFLG
jgi:hypothetical protein